MDELSEFGVFWGKELYECVNTKNPIIEGVLYENDIACLSSPPGIGKTLIVLQLICDLTTGGRFLDTYAVCRPLNVLYIQAEGDRAETIERLRNMRKSKQIDDKKWVHINVAGIALNTDKGFRELMAYAEAPKLKYDVVIIDPLYTTVRGSLSSDEVATDWIRNMRTFRAHYGCTILITHHDNKDSFTDKGEIIHKGLSSVFGSVFWLAFFNQNFKLKKENGIHILESGKQRSGKIIDRIEMRLLEPSPLMFTFKDSIRGENIQVAQHRIDLAEEGIRIKDLQEYLGVSRATIYRILGKLKDRGTVVSHEIHGVMYYSTVREDIIQQTKGEGL